MTQHSKLNQMAHVIGVWPASAILVGCCSGGGQVERRPVRVGAASATAMEVLDGLKPGDRVVLE